MTARVACGALAGLGFGMGLLLVLSAWAGPARVSRERRARPVPWVRVGAGLGTGLAVLVVTRWIAAAIALGVAGACWRQLFGGARAARAALERLEALAAWTESLRDLVATGTALPEALSASQAAAGPALVGPVGSLVERLRSREPLDAALRGFAADLDDVTADLVVAALLLNSRAQGRQLHAVLSALARSARQEVAMRRAVEAERRSTRRGVRTVLLVTVVMALGLDLLNPAYVAPYRTSTGQLVLAVVVAVFAFGFGWLQRLARFPAPGRFLDPVAAPPQEPAPSTTELTR